MKDIVFRTIMIKGEGGSTIASIEKTSSALNVDTYTITFNDDTEPQTFEVTNGSSIESIEKTASSGLIDTYTVSLTDGTTTSFQVKNGADASYYEVPQDSVIGFDHSEDELTYTGNTIDISGVAEITSLELNGLTSQDGTPTPASPVDVLGLGGYDKKIVLDGTETWYMASNYSGLFYTSYIDDYSGGFAPVCDSIKGIYNSSITTIADAGAILQNKQASFRQGATKDRIFIKMTDFASANDFKAYLSAHPLTVGYRSTSYDSTANQYYGVGIEDDDGNFHGISTVDMIPPLYEGDTIDFVSGVVTRKNAFYSYDRCVSIQSVNQYNIVNIVLKTGSSMFDSNSAMANYLERQTTPIASTQTNGIFNNAGDIFARIESDLVGTTASEVNSYLANNPIDVVIKITTPTTSSVLLSEDISSITGVLTFTCSTDTSMTVTVTTSENYLPQGYEEFESPFDDILNPNSKNAVQNRIIARALEYQTGDVIVLNGNVYAGFITSANKELLFYIPLAKPISSHVNNVVVDIRDFIIRHADGGYIANRVSLDSIGTVSANIDWNRGGVNLRITLNNASSFTNNSLVAMICYGTSNLILS